MGVIVVRALPAKVCRERTDIDWTDGLCPIALLPSEVRVETTEQIDLVRRCSFQTLKQLPQRYGRSNANHEVNVIRRHTSEQNLAVDASPARTDGVEKNGIETRRQSAPSPKGGEDAMYEDVRAGMGHSPYRPE
jgi:hypothetical protein